MAFLFPDRSLILIVIVLSNGVIAYGDLRQSQCQEQRCGRTGPPVRFPFRLKDSRGRPNDSCSYPGFELFCVGSETALNLSLSQSSKLLLVSKIDYKAQEIRVKSDSNCLPKVLLSELGNRSADSGFQFGYSGGKKSSYTMLKCPTRTEPCRTVLVRSDSEVRLSRNDVLSCTKIGDFESVPDQIYRILWHGYSGSDIRLRWSKPDCRNCEAEGNRCGLRNNGSKPEEIECYKSRKANSKILMTTSIASGGSIFLLLTIVASLYIYISNKNKKNQSRRIEKFLQDYFALKPSRYSYADLKKITNEFGKTLGQGAYATVFEGKLSNDILVAVKILNISKGNGDDFINEVATMTQIHHVNIARLVGFCADGSTRALVYEFLPNGSLQKYISPPSLSPETFYNIALGVAKGIEYLHQGCDKRILHFDIKPSNILLDRNFVPKISDFGLAKLCSKDQSAVSMNTARGTAGYIAPEVFSRNFGNVSYKSDVYSFGMLLLEIVGRRKNTLVTEDDVDEIYYPEWIYNLLEEGDDLRIFVGEERSTEVMKKLAIIGLWCIQWHPADRPTMKYVVQMLEERSELTVPPNPFASLGASNAIAKVLATRMQVELEAIPEYA